MRRLLSGLVLLAACGGTRESVDLGADAGSVDAGADLGAPDFGAPDLGVVDGGAHDLGVADAGRPDAGAPDGGTAGDMGAHPTDCRTAPCPAGSICMFCVPAGWVCRSGHFICD